MIRRTIRQLREMIKAENGLTPFEDIEINGVVIDSRQVKKNNLFIPLKGEKVDGHQFVEDSIKNGAAAALWQKDVPNPPLHLPVIIVEDTLSALQELARSYRSQLNTRVIGITGSNGKTTTKDITASLLALRYKVQKTEGNFNNHIGLPLTILGLREDTEIAVLEMGMSGKGEIQFLSELACPDVAIITNIGESHLLDLGSREGIADAKLEIIKGLPPQGLVIYHGDEPLLKERICRYEGKLTFKTFGRSEKNTLYPLSIDADNHGSRFKINGHDTLFKLPILGIHNVLNALAAMLAAESFGISFEKMNEAFSTFKLTNMRMEMLEGAKGEKIINDAYNASPTSMKAAIELVSRMTGFSKKILILGDMLELGPQEEDFHYEIGRGINGHGVDYVFTIGTLGKHIARGARQSLPEERVFSFLEKEPLIEEVKKYTDSNTLILVKASRGMRLEEIVKALQ